GMFASFDPVALDQACADACLGAKPLPNSVLTDNLASKGFVDRHDHFKNTTPESEWETQLAHGEKIGLGTRKYDLIRMK
ncbi:MAG: 4Fe-4S ferredoxin, partial [Thermoguttaceae bacterium]|nr:4Fe-4S ferredoxin [Thermoguttaceae bacterium]